MKLRALFAVAALASLAVLACHGAVDRTTCESAAAQAKWDMAATLATGPSNCPTISTTYTLPGACGPGCSCPDSTISFEPASGAQPDDRCYLRFDQTCGDGTALDCRDTQLDSATHASGSCYFSGPADLKCTYSVEWTKQ